MEPVAMPAVQVDAPNPPAGVVDPFQRTPMVVNPGPRQIRIAILLPTRSPSLGKVALAVLDGVKAGYEREPDRISIQTIDTDGSPEDTVRGYAEAVAHNDIVIGPLSRTEVNAIAKISTAVQPTVVLTPKESEGAPLPLHMLPVGLSVEDEARQVAEWAYEMPPPPPPVPTSETGEPPSHPVVTEPGLHGPIFAIASDVAWQKRATKAFAAEMALHNIKTEQVELPMIEGYLSAEDIIALKKKIQQENPSMLFVGFDARLAAQLRLAIGDDLAIYGTSQLNPRTPLDWKTMEPIQQMDGMRLIDIPWQLEPDHPAVMVYPQIVDQGDERHGPVVERLYALGIDAYRIAREIALDRTSFSLDGVTGKLSVNFGRTDGSFDRVEQPALYRNGMIVPAGTKP